ncbi:MAG TPA: cell division protein FtsQ/DivIB [Gallionella sp.]|nr:cell division protein FtsQ/DivIB [Gallionella sp.]
MWDNAPLLRGIANALLAFSMAAVMYGALYYLVNLPGWFPLHSVQLSAAPERADAGEVLQVVRNEVRGNFFTVDLERLRAALEKLPWVRTASIRRTFPDRLTVELEEHQALARWNGNALVNRQGEVFYASSTQVLPEFIGQDGTAPELVESYAQFSRQLVPLNLQVTQLALTPRHAWQLRLSNGIVLELGREQLQQRLGTFVTVYPYSLAALPASVVRASGGKGAAPAAARQMQVKYVDLRYRNGFAVRLGRNDA